MIELPRNKREEGNMLTDATTEQLAQREALEDLRQEVGRLQQEVMRRKAPVAIVLEGWGAAGKGSSIASLIFAMDPRGFRVHSLASRREKDAFSLLSKYFTRLPAYGEIGIFDRSWYRQLAGKPSRPREELLKWIETFERQFTDDGGILIKLFLDISQKEQRRRLEKLESSKATAWRVTEADWEQNRHYHAYEKRFAAMRQATDFAFAPWTVIDAGERKAAVYGVHQAVVQGIRAGLERPARAERGVYTGGFALGKVEKISQMEWREALPQEEYKERMAALRQRISLLHNEIYVKRLPVIVCYEGWDAAGKGGNIKRLTRALDPRGYEVFPIAAPDRTELNHHYLWRFCNRLPKAGHVAVFDRSWYGRVMVERIEGLCPQERWERAYGEINEFEYELFRWGAVILKFFLNIDKDEQLRRFEERRDTPEKQWKLTEEDWRNREKWEQYETAIDEMTARTSTDFAPWHIIPSNDKKYARIRAMELFAEAVERRLGQR